MKKTFSVLMSLGLATAMLAVTADESFARRRHHRVYSRDMQCRDYAAQQVQDHMDNGVGNGALLGAGAGGLYGGITGNGAGSNIATGLIGGAIGGALLGGITHSSNRDRVYRIAYDNCMNNY